MKIVTNKLLNQADGSVLVVGGSNKGGLVLNEASINVPTYEIVYASLAFDFIFTISDLD
jgi:hypothetical protein